MARLYISILLACLPGLALADLVCTYTLECIEGEDCNETEFSYTIETGLVPGAILAEDGFPTDDQIVTDAETIPITWTARMFDLGAIGASASGFHMFTLRPDGEARHFTHLLDAGFTILYLGTCERA